MDLGRVHSGEHVGGEMARFHFDDPDTRPTLDIHSIGFSPSP